MNRFQIKKEYFTKLDAYHSVKIRVARLAVNRDKIVEVARKIDERANELCDKVTIPDIYLENLEVLKLRTMSGEHCRQYYFNLRRDFPPGNAISDRLLTLLVEADQHPFTCIRLPTAIHYYGSSQGEITFLKETFGPYLKIEIQDKELAKFYKLQALFEE